MERSQGHAGSLRYLGNIHAFRTEWREAKVQYQKILSENPLDLYARLKLSRVLLNTGDPGGVCRNLNIIFENRNRSSFFNDHQKSIASIIKSLGARIPRENIPADCQKLFQFFEHNIISDLKKK